MYSIIIVNRSHLNTEEKEDKHLKKIVCRYWYVLKSLYFDPRDLMSTSHKNVMYYFIMNS